MNILISPGSRIRLLVNSLICTFFFLLVTPNAFSQGFIPPTPFIDYQYTYDGTGNVTGIADHINPANNRMMIYDPVDRLRSVKGPWGNGKFTYDALGNITGSEVDDVFKSYSYDQSTNLPQHLEHDAAGNIIADENFRYVFDAGNRLIEVHSGSTVVASYEYDVFGRKISRTDSTGETIYFAYGSGDGVLTEFSKVGFPIYDYIYAGSENIARIDFDATGTPARTSFYSTDHLGSIIAVTDETTTVVWDRLYLPFGEEYREYNADLLDNTRRYSAKELDEEIGLYYFGARFYKADLGRFLSVDPVGIDITNPQSINRYAYVQNNPYTYIDPDGRQLVRFNSKEDGENFDPASLVGPTALVGPVKSVAARLINRGISFIKSHIGTGVNNPVPERLARVIDKRLFDRGVVRIGPPSSSDVFVTSADDISSLNSSFLISNKLTLVNHRGNLSKGPFTIIEFNTPQSIASPINRPNPGFVGFGKTKGGATEFVIPNLRIDELKGVTIRHVP